MIMGAYLGVLTTVYLKHFSCAGESTSFRQTGSRHGRGGRIRTGVTGK